MVAHLYVCVHVESKIHAEQMTYHTQSTNVDVHQCGNASVLLSLLALRKRFHIQDTHDVCHLCGYVYVAKGVTFPQKFSCTESTHMVVHLYDASYVWPNLLSVQKPLNMSRRYVVSHHHEV